MNLPAIKTITQKTMDTSNTQITASEQAGTLEAGLQYSMQRLTRLPGDANAENAIVGEIPKGVQIQC